MLPAWFGYWFKNVVLNIKYIDNLLQFIPQVFYMLLKLGGKLIKNPAFLQKKSCISRLAKVTEILLREKQLWKSN